MAGFLPDLYLNAQPPCQPVKKLDVWQMPLLSQAGSESMPTITTSVHPPRLDHFNARITPADHFRWFQKNQVSASGRVFVGTDQDNDTQRVTDGKKNLLELVKLMHPQLSHTAVATGTVDRALEKAAHKTAIVDLRTMGDAKLTGAVLASNDNEMKAELEAAQELGIEHKNFPMNSHELQSPSFIKNVVDYIHAQVKHGKVVDIHCYHGTDRTGLIAQCELVTYDPKLRHLINQKGQKDQKDQKGIDEVYAQSLQSLLDSGVDPGDHSEIYQSMKEYLLSLRDTKDAVSLSQIPIDGDQAQIKALQEAADTLLKSPTMDTYLSLLRSNITMFDPALHSAFYRQLYHEFNKAYTQKH